MSKKAFLVLGLGAGLAGLYWFYKKQSDGESYLIGVDGVDGVDGVGDVVDVVVGGTVGAFMNVGFSPRRAGGVSVDILSNKNVKAFLQVIRRGEGTLGDIGYKTIFGGSTFQSFADHPRKKITKSGYTSTAAGAYQFLISSWDETAKIMGLKDFSPLNQDLAAVGRIAMRGALQDVMAGNFEVAVKKTAKEWASLPFSPYGQPTQTFSGARAFYVQNGGVIAT